MGSSTGSINTMKYGSNLSLDSMKSSKSPRMSRKQMSMASSIVGIPEGEQRKFEKNRLFPWFLDIFTTSFLFL